MLLELENHSIILYSIFIFGFYSSALLSILRDYRKDTQHTQDKDIYGIYIKAFPLVAFNVFISIPIILYLFQFFNHLLTPFSIKQFIHIPISLFIVDFFFFSLHYLFHTKKYLNLYKYHKIHHQIKTPVSITSLYLHPIDLLFGNILPLFLPIIVLRSSFPILCLWLFITITETTYMAHSGVKYYCENHDNHHKYFIYNYGTGTYLCDRLCNTFFK